MALAVSDDARALGIRVEGFAVVIELGDGLKAVANAFWEKRGAKFGQVQTNADIITENDGSFCDRPARFTDETRFVTLCADIEVGGYDGRRIVCALWVKPYLKSGKLGQAIRLTYLSMPKW